MSAPGRLVSTLWGSDPERLWPWARRLVAPVTLWLAPSSSAYGAERVPATGGGVVAANHLSAIDPPLVGYVTHEGIGDPAVVANGTNDLQHRRLVAVAIDGDDQAVMSQTPGYGTAQPT